MNKQNIADTQTFLVLLKGICVLWMCSSRWAALSHKGALIGLYFCPSCRKTSRTNWNKVYFLLLKSPSPCLSLLVWTGLLKPMRNLILQTYFADVSVETLGGVADCPFLCQYYSRNTDCLQPMAPHSQTTILDERLSIHCNSSCLYNRCGSTDVYVLYSRVHFYYLQIKDCVEEDHGFFERSGLKSLWSRCLQSLVEHDECDCDIHRESSNNTR